MNTALVTGGNKGIGLAACKGLCAQGFHVFVGSRNEQRGQAACDALRASGGKADFILLDTSDEASIQQAATTLAAHIDHLDALVNNAGIFLDNQATGLTVEPNIILDTFTTNTLGPLLVTRAMLPLLAKSQHAQVINVSSGMGQLSEMSGGSAAYRLSKTALNAVTRILASELAQQHIHVNSICPGWVKTDMGGQGAPRTVEQGADTIIWLATGQAGHQTGAFFRDRAKIAW